MTCTTPRERGPPVRKKTSGFALTQLFCIFPEREIKMEEGGLGEKKMRKRVGLFDELWVSSSESKKKIRLKVT